MATKQPKQPAKTFTLESANATLPLVRVIVKDLMEKWRDLGRLRASLAEAEAGPEPKRKRVREDVARAEEEIAGCVREIQELGATVKDFDIGLVDFPMQHGAKTILLCWKAGEAAIEHFHDMNSGFAGRKPIAELPR
jgi:hypothetical protein